MKVQEQVSWGWASPQWMKNQWKDYKINFDQWKQFWELQGGKCGGCGKDLAHPLIKEMKTGLKPETDHLHVEGRRCEEQDVRGLLCHNCNNLLGKIRDNMKILHGLLAYLKRHGEL